MLSYLKTPNSFVDINPISSMKWMNTD